MSTHGAPPHRYMPKGHFHIPTIEAHASLGALSWGLVIPIGAILFTLRRYPSSSPLKTPRNTFWLHTVIQTIGVLMALANFGLGVSISLKYKKTIFHDPHTIIGTVVIVLMLLQPVLGGIHHILYKKAVKQEGLRSLSSEDERLEKEGVATRQVPADELYPSTTNNSTPEHAGNLGRNWSIFGIAHRWIGRVTITLAMIDSGLGFRLSKEFRPVFSYPGQVAYGALVTLIWAIWVSFIVGGFLGRRREAMRLRGGRL